MLRGVDPSDPATAASAPFLNVNYLAGFSPNALRGKRIGLWLAGTRGGERARGGPGDSTKAPRSPRLSRLGATVVPGPTSPYLDQIGGPGFAALLVEFEEPPTSTPTWPLGQARDPSTTSPG